MTAGWSVPPLVPTWRTCSLCGAKSDDEAQVHPAMWPLRSGGWTSGARCFDRAGCRDRTEARGSAWPVADGTPATPAPSSPTGQTRHDPEGWSFDR